MCHLEWHRGIYRKNLSHCEDCPGLSGESSIITQTYKTAESNFVLQKIRKESKDQGRGKHAWNQGGTVIFKHTLMTPTLKLTQPLYEC